MIRKLKRACGIHFSTKALVRNPGVHLRQMSRRHRSFRGLLDELADERRIVVVQVGANDGGDALGNLIRDRPERIERALLIEPQRSAFDRLARRNEAVSDVVCLNAAIDRQAGERTIYSVNRGAVARLGDGIASFDRHHVERAIRARTKLRSDGEIEALITATPVPVTTLAHAAAGAGIVHPDVFMVDTEGFDAEIVRMAFEAGWLPAVIQYEHKHLSRGDRRDLSTVLERRGYRLWADQADVWGLRAGAHRTSPSGGAGHGASATPIPSNSGRNTPLRFERCVAPDGRPFVLSGSEPFAKGGYRHCYVHPDNTDLCIKVVARPHDCRCHDQQRQEIADLVWLRKRRSDAFSNRIPAFEGLVDTDFGVGIVTRLCRDSDGRISRDLAEIIRERSLSPPLIRAVDDLEHWLRQHRLLIGDAGPKNVVAVRSDGDDWTLVIIEGWRHRRWHWLARLHPLFADWLIRRQMRKFRRRATIIAKCRHRVS